MLSAYLEIFITLSSTRGKTPVDIQRETSRSSRVVRRTLDELKKEGFAFNNEGRWSLTPSGKVERHEYADALVPVVESLRNC